MRNNVFLAETNPELVKEWHPTKNGNLTPYNTSCGRKIKVWWLLPYDDPKTGKHFDFEWEAWLHNRRRGTSCPYLTNQAVFEGYNDLQTLSPHLLKFWSPKNKIKPTEISPHSHRSVYWKCENGHDYVAKIYAVNTELCSCPYCRRDKGTKGEKEVFEKLSKLGLEELIFSQYTFNNCKNIRSLRFDFVLKRNNQILLAIEFDGKQHFEEVSFFYKNNTKESLERNQKRDKIKTEFCKQNNIPLLRIPYWDFDRIEEILEKELKSLAII